MRAYHFFMKFMRGLLTGFCVGLAVFSLLAAGILVFCGIFFA